MTLSQEATSSSPQWVFQSIRLVNFVIHRDTTIHFDQSPVVLITGSNGSGKTLILDALLFAIGVDSKRAQRQRNAAFIGRFGKHAEVVLKLNNLVLNGNRILQSPDPAFSKLLNQDEVAIRLRINPSNKISYWVNDQRTVNGNPISRREIRQLFQSAGLFGDSPLAVTEAETLDQFASQSPRRKFETLLNETGLREWMEKLEDTRLLVNQAQANVKPLQYRLRHEEQRLQVLKTAYEAFQQKQQLQQRLQDLTIEAAWAEVVYREELVEQLQVTITELNTSLTAEREKLSKLDQQKADLNSRFEGLQTKQTDLQNSIEHIRDQLMQVKGHRIGIEKELESIREQRDKYTTKKRQRSSKTKEDLLRQELKDLVSERDQLDSKLEAIRQCIISYEEELIAEPQRFPRYEENILRTAQQYRHELDAFDLSSTVIGPIFSLIRMKPGHEHLEDAVKRAFGRYTYAFIALDRSAFKEAKTLYDKLWPQEKPNLMVARINPTTAIKSDRPQVTSPVYGWAADLIDGDPYTVSFLSRVVNTAVAEETSDPNELADAAQHLGGNIITSEGTSYYLRIGGFARPPRPVEVRLGVSLKEIGLIRDTIHQRGQLREAREKESQHMRDRMRINSEITQIRTQLQDLHHEHFSSLSKKERSLLETDLERRTSELQQQILELDTQIDTLEQEFHQCNTDLTPLLSKIQHTQNQLQRLEYRRSHQTAALDHLSEELHQREDEQDHLLTQIKEFRKTATKQGERPTTVRAPNEVRDDQLQINAMIDTITATAADLKAYEEQEKSVQQLRTYLEERQQHLENLKTDVERRLSEWQRHLENTVKTLNIRMNQLLSHFLKQVNLTIRYPNEPSRAELHLQIAINRKGAWRTYQNMSGGERVLATQTFILALHTLAKSPLHVIDEFTQRLDEASRAAVLSIVQRAIELSQESSVIDPQFLLMAPSTVGLQIPSPIHHVVLIKGRVES